MKKNHYILLFFVLICSAGVAQVDATQRKSAAPGQSIVPQSAEVNQNTGRNYAQDKHSQTPPPEPVSKENNPGILSTPTADKKKPQ